MTGRQRKPDSQMGERIQEQDIGIANSTDLPNEKNPQYPEYEHGVTGQHHINHHVLHMPHLANRPGYNHNGHKITKGIKPDGESGRAWIHPIHFLRICFYSSSPASMVVNFLWPFVPAAIIVHCLHPNNRTVELHCWTFALNYIAMVPTANLIGFAGQELARKVPKVLGKLPFCACVCSWSRLLQILLHVDPARLHPVIDQRLTLLRHPSRNLSGRYCRDRPVRGPSTQ